MRKQLTRPTHTLDAPLRPRRAWLARVALGALLRAPALGAALSVGLVASLVAPGLATAQDSALAKVTEGKQLYKQKKFQEAAATFEQAIAIDPSISDAYMGLGRTYEKLDRADDALAIYDRAYKKFPDQADFLKRQGVVYRQVKRYDDSASAYRAYIAINAADPDPYYGLAQTLQLSGDNAGALEAAERYIALEQRPEEQKYVARAREMVTELRGAAPAATPAPAETPAVTPVPDTPPAPALAERTPQPPPELPASLQKPAVAAADPSQTLADADLAFQNRDYVKATELYLAVTAARPNSAEAFYKLGVALACIQQFGLAIDAWEAALKSAPDLAPARENITRTQRRLAIDATLDPDLLHRGSPDQRRDLARRYLSENRFSMALRAAQSLLILAPADPTTHRLLAQIYLGLLQPDLALAALNHELSLQPGDFQIYALMSDAYALQGDPRRAVYFLTLFLDNTDPDRQSPAHAEPRARLDQLSRLAEQTPAAP
jgi:tetratricopeptide (TPR) repeat protein